MLSIGFILVFLDWPSMAPKAPSVNLPSLGGWLEAGFYFYINSLLYHLVLRIQAWFSIV